MDRVLRLSLRVFGILVIAAPLSVVTTILLFPLWSWVEASTGIESLGHSGPAAWCFGVVFLVLASAALTVFIRYRTKNRSLRP